MRPRNTSPLFSSETFTKTQSTISHRKFNGHSVVDLKGDREYHNATWAFQVTGHNCKQPFRGWGQLSMPAFQVEAHPADYASYIWRGPQGQEIDSAGLERYEKTVNGEDVRLVIFNPTLADMGPYPVEVVKLLF